jgi:hypothetical protein
MTACMRTQCLTTDRKMILLGCNHCNHYNHYNHYSGICILVANGLL